MSEIPVADQAPIRMDARVVRDPCGIQSRTVLHFPAGSRNRRPYFINKNSRISSSGGSTNQGVVGSNPAGRASNIKELGQRPNSFFLAIQHSGDSAGDPGADVSSPSR